VSDPTGSHGMRLGLMQPLNLIMAYHRLGRLLLNHFLAYRHHGRLPLAWPTSPWGTWPLTCMRYFLGKAIGLQST